MKNSWIAPVAALVVGAAGGYISGKGADDAATANAGAEAGVRTRASERGTQAAATGGGARKQVRGASTEEISHMPGNSTRIQALLEFYSSLTPEQLAEEATKLDALPMNERIMASFLLFGKWAEVDPTAAMSFSGTMGFAGMFVRPTILQSWASVDPENAAKYLESNPREFGMMGMMGRGGPMGGQGPAGIIAAEWARQDPAGAMAWASSQTKDRGEAMNSVISEIAKTDPKQAVSMIAKLDEGDRGDAYRNVAAQYGAANFGEAQAWIRTLPGDDQAAAMASAIGGLSNSDPHAASLEAAKMAEGGEKDRVIPDVVGDLARQDAQAAADFLKKEGSERAKRDGMRELMPTWTNQNPAAALTYAKSFEDPKVRDSAIQAWAWSNNTSPPADVFNEAAAIVDDGDRNRTMGIAARRWMGEDKDAATAAVQASTSISDDAKKEIMSGGGGGWGGRGRGR